MGEHTSITQCTDLDLSKQIHTNVTVEIEFQFFPKGWWGLILIVWEWEQKATAQIEEKMEKGDGDCEYLEEEVYPASEH